MRISEEHFLTEALHMQSPNADARPVSGDISLLVIHCIIIFGRLKWEITLT